ncbi:hypothetical protein ACGFY6_33050 [Streptomyces sp. NPDC048387]|uniref:hypothetical protein n=1 Tax=Streptomyces sp. NPDC048387 TaxID=3365542 RepID=UPI0037211ABC
MHLRAEQTGEGKGYPFDDIHPDVAWTFASKEPINVIEDSLNGPLDTPLGITGAGPRQRLQRDDPASFRGFNPLLVPQRFRDPVTREAIKAAALLAVYDAAAERAQEVPRPGAIPAARGAERRPGPGGARQGGHPRGCGEQAS